MGQERRRHVISTLLTAGAVILVLAVVAIGAAFWTRSTDEPAQQEPRRLISTFDWPSGERFDCASSDGVNLVLALSVDDEPDIGIMCVGKSKPMFYLMADATLARSIAAALNRLADRATWKQEPRTAEDVARR